MHEQLERSSSSLKADFLQDQDGSSDPRTKRIRSFNSFALRHLLEKHLGIGDGVMGQVFSQPFQPVGNSPHRNANPGRDAVQVHLLGYAAPPDPSGGVYKSNYELSLARTVRVQETLKYFTDTFGLFERVEWLLTPMSSELEAAELWNRFPSDLLSEEEVGGQPLDITRSVEVRIYRSESRPDSPALELLDYLYFAIYTITTTGYGDIVPVSVFARWITAAANLFEVFFVVIFFNVLLGVLHSGNREHHQEILDEARDRPALPAGPEVE